MLKSEWRPDLYLSTEKDQGAEEDDDTAVPEEEEEEVDTEEDVQEGKEEEDIDSEEGDDEDDPENWDAARAARTIRTLRKVDKRQAKQLKAQKAELKAFRDAQKTAEDAEKSEVERLREENKGVEALRTALKSERISNALIREAAKMKFRDPEDVCRYIDFNGDIEYDSESGSVEGVKEALKNLAKEKEYLLEPEKSDGPPRGTPRRGSARERQGIAAPTGREGEGEAAVRERPITL